MTKGFQCNKCGKLFVSDPVSKYISKKYTPDYTLTLELEFCGICDDEISNFIKGLPQPP